MGAAALRAALLLAGAAVIAAVMLLLEAGAAAPGAARLELLWGRRVELTGRGVTTGEAADLDGDGLDEIVLHRGTRDEPSSVVALDGRNGRELWRRGFPRRARVLVADLDGAGADVDGIRAGVDGTRAGVDGIRADVGRTRGADVAVACGSDLTVFAGATGERLAGAGLPGIAGDLAWGRLGDGRSFVVCSSGERVDDALNVFADGGFAGNGLAELWSRGAPAEDGPFADGFTHPVTLDVDGDGTDEVLVAENGNRLLCLSSSGELLWDTVLGKRERLDPEGVVSAAPVAADLLGDGLKELAVGCFAGAVVVMDAGSGEVLDRVQFGMEAHEEHLGDPKIPSFIRAVLGRTGEPVNCLTAAELDGGPGLELVLGCSDGLLYALDPGEGRTIWRFETGETVYDPCIVVESGRTGAHGDSKVGDPGTHDLLAWNVDGVFLLDGRTGAALQNIREASGTSVLIPCELDGDPGPEFVHLPLEGRRVTAWRLVAARGPVR